MERLWHLRAAPISSLQGASSNRISLTECFWVLQTRRGGAKRHPCRKTPKIAIHGDFPLKAHHSVSEIADFSPEPCKDEIGAARRCHSLSAPSFTPVPLAVQTVTAQ